MQLLESTKSKIARASADIAGYLAGLLADLYQVDLALTPDLPDATLTAAVATFAGYAQGVVVWGTPSEADDGNIEVVGTMTEWRPTDAVTPNMIYGIYFHEAAGAHNWVFAGRFDTAPIPMENALRTLTVTVRYRPADKSLVAYVS